MTKEVRQLIKAPVYGQVAGRDLTVVTINFSNRQRARKPATKLQRATSDHRQLLTLLDQVPDRIAVLDFMAREFGTRLVLELNASQTYRVRRYAEVIISARIDQGRLVRSKVAHF